MIQHAQSQWETDMSQQGGYFIDSEEIHMSNHDYGQRWRVKWCPEDVLQGGRSAGEAS